MDYLNRYCTGICLLKHLISEIHMKYEVVNNVFGSDYCRFLIDVNFVDFKSLSLKELNVANQYFYNSCSNSGSQYVSFRYNSFNSRGINEKIVLLFISCYGIAEQLLKGFIRNIIPPTCSITIADLKNEPLFCYIVDFIVDEPYISFEKDMQMSKKEILIRMSIYTIHLRKNLQVFPESVFQISIFIELVEGLVQISVHLF